MPQDLACYAETDGGIFIGALTCHHHTQELRSGDMGIDSTVVAIDDLPEEYAEVARDIGLEPALKLIGGWGGSRLYVPTLRDLKRRLLRDRATALLEEGVSRPQVCRKLRITRARLNALLAEG